MINYISKAMLIRAIKWTGDNIYDVQEFLGDCYIFSNGIYVFFKRGKVSPVERTGTCGICGVGNYIVDDTIFTSKPASEFERDYMELKEEGADGSGC